MSETLDAIPEMRDFLSLVKAASLVETMETPNKTIFVPSNEAIEDYTIELEAQVGHDESQLKSNLNEDNYFRTNLKTKLEKKATVCLEEREKFTI